MLKPRDQWRPGMTPRSSGRARRAGEAPRRVERLDIRSRPASTCSRPASARPWASRSWVRTWRRSSNSARRSRTIVKAVPGTTSVYAERTATGRYVDIDIDRVAAGRYGAQHQGRAGHRRQRRGRHDGQLHRGRPRTVPDQPALSAGIPRFARETAAAADCRAHRCERDAAGRRPGRNRRWPRHDPQRERRARRAGFSSTSRTRPRWLRQRGQGACCGRADRFPRATASAGPGSTSTCSGRSSA